MHTNSAKLKKKLLGIGIALFMLLCLALYSWSIYELRIGKSIDQISSVKYVPIVSETALAIWVGLILLVAHQKRYSKQRLITSSLAYLVFVCLFFTLSVVIAKQDLFYMLQVLMVFLLEVNPTAGRP